MIRIVTALLFFFSFHSVSEAQIPKWKITDVEKYIAANKNSVLVINFWATFCKPCIAEIPFIQRITKEQASQNVKLLLVSLDMPSAFPAKVIAMADKLKFNKDIIVWLAETNADYFCPKVDPSWSGSIPATLIINTATGYRKFLEEEMEEKAFITELERAKKG